MLFVHYFYLSIYLFVLQLLLFIQLYLFKFILSNLFNLSIFMFFIYLYFSNTAATAGLATASVELGRSANYWAFCRPPFRAKK